jgi:transposase
MKDRKAVQVRLSKPEQRRLDELLRGGLQPVRTVLRALVLRQLADGQAIRKVARNVGLTPKTVWLTSQRYQQGGLEGALYERARPGKEARLDAQQRQRIVALVCSPPPEGRARWTVRLLAEEAVKRKLVPGVGRETVRILLESHDLKPWREKMWCVAELDEEYVARMEDVLAVYEKPLSAREPVVCIDEKPVLLHQEVRPPVALQPGRVARRDAEYRRCGTANVFCGVQPKAGRHFTKVTNDRSSPQFAHYLLDIATVYPEADTLHLVMDHLSSHTRKAVVERFGAEAGDWLWNRFTVHYTPKHGSWLNQAEIAISLFSRQCLGQRRIGDRASLRKETRAWNRRANRDRVTIQWSFTRKQARHKFGYKIIRSRY